VAGLPRALGCWTPAAGLCKGGVWAAPGWEGPEPGGLVIGSAGRGRGFRATGRTVSSRPGSRPIAAQSCSGAIAARGSAACASHGEFEPGFCRSSAPPLGPLKGPSRWRPVPACPRAPASPPRRSFPGLLGFRGVSRPRLGPHSPARDPCGRRVLRYPTQSSILCRSPRPTLGTRERPPSA
jgi:hypothetical protein